MTQAAGGCIARVGEGLTAALGLARIERLETGLGHIDLAAHLQHLGPAFALQPERHIADGAHIAADILAGAAVATGGATHQLAVFVAQADRQTIELGLAAVRHLGAAAEQITAWQVEALAYAAIKVQQVIIVKGVAKTQHRHFVTHLAKGAQRLAAHPLGRRLRGHQFRMRRLQRLQLTEQAVVLGIRNTRLIQHVITVVVRIQLIAQCGYTLGGVTHCK